MVCARRDALRVTWLEEHGVPRDCYKPLLLLGLSEGGVVAVGPELVEPSGARFSVAGKRVWLVFEEATGEFYALVGDGFAGVEAGRVGFRDVVFERLRLQISGRVLEGEFPVVEFKGDSRVLRVLLVREDILQNRFLASLYSVDVLLEGGAGVLQVVVV